MALLSNSSLHNWISFEDTTWNNASFPPCQRVDWSSPFDDEMHQVRHITNVSCTQICNDSISLFGWQDNLATCGLWVTLGYTYNFGQSGLISDASKNDPVGLLNSFADVGLDIDDPDYFQSAVGYGGVISTCFESIYQRTRKVEVDGLVSGACTRKGLFPYSYESYIQTCLEEICSPVAFDPDLTGVGFVISFILQSTIAIMAFPVLLGLESLHWSNKVTLAALVSFHKAQCYFSSTVQIAALIGFLGNTRSVLQPDPDTSALVILATSGFIPVTFGLASITRFGRPSWHLIMLSFITFALASATLLHYNNYDRRYGASDSYMSSLEIDGFDDFGGCSIGGHMSDTLFPLCGSSLLDSNTIPSSTITDRWVWVAWATCMAWMLSCFFSKLIDGFLPNAVRSRLEVVIRHPWMQPLKTFMSSLNARLLILIASSALCFSVQFYLISVFNRHDLVSQVWSFGQIVAVTVWIPSMFELFYDVVTDSENSLKREYPSPLIVMKSMVEQTVNMANISPIEGSNYAKLSDSDAEAVPLHTFGSTAYGHSTGQDSQQ